MLRRRCRVAAVKKRVLVTGASGLIGHHLVMHLLDQGFTVIGLARSYPLASLSPAPSYYDHPDFVPVPGDIRDSAILNALFARYRPTHLVHLAAQPIVGTALSSAEDTFDINIRGTWCVLEAARDYGALSSVVVASSDKAYGAHEELPYREDHALRACYPYDVSKKITEELALSYFHSYGLPVTITRCGNVFGAGDLNMSRIIPGTILSCLRGEDIIVRSTGEHQRCYVYGEDVAEAYRAILDADAHEVAGQAFNIGNADAVSVLDLVAMIRDVMGADEVGVIVQGQAPGEIVHQSLDCEKIQRTLGWSARTPLRRALEQTVAWYRSHQKALEALCNEAGPA
ncbi:MAG: sugar dehydratase [Alcanivorax sp.]|nr:sugar dehydratase [Alcanivorax sp.]